MKRSKVKEIVVIPARIIIGLPKAIKIANEESYNPEKKRKILPKRITDNILWLIRYHEPNRFYNLYGFDIKNNKGVEKSYINYLEFAHDRDEKNQLKEVCSQVILLRDKLLFYKYMKSNGLPVPEVFAVLINGVLFDIDMNKISEVDLKEVKDYFVKDMDGECASYVKHINDYNEFLKNKKNIYKYNCIFQKKLVQQSQMSIINPKAINTLRIVTVYNNGNPYVLSALLRVGTKKSGNVDNWAKGGLAIGIRKDGYLKKYGYYKPHYGTKTNIHPDTNVVFTDFLIPQWDVACKTACKAHKVFYNVETIGWDIAITSDGPMFIEGNDNWEISLNQVVDNGLKVKWIKAMKDYDNKK